MKTLGFLLATLSVTSFANELDTLHQFQIGYLDQENQVRASNSDFDVQTLFLQARSRFNYKISEQWSAFTDVRVLLTDGDSVFFEDDIAIDDNALQRDSLVGELRQLYVRYNGITGYPGEYLTIGLQRLREPSGMWWDTDIESIVWRGDTTQFDWTLGIGQQFERYRTDIDFTQDREDVFRAFSELSYDWQPYHKITLRGAYARQSNDELNQQNFIDVAGGINGNRYWLSSSLSHNWYDKRQPGQLAYNAEVILQRGDGDFRDLGDNLVTKDIQAYAIDTGFRYDFAHSGFSLGATFTLASGGESDTETENFSQTGINTNRSRVSGNREFLFRYNEALRLDISNLTHLAVFASFSMSDQTHAVASIGRFQRTENEAPVFVLGRPLPTVDGEDSVGIGYDVSILHFPKRKFKLPLRLIRFRASSFNPSSALIEQNNDHRITLEAQFVL